MSREALLERVERLNVRLAAKPKYVDVKIVGWGGKRNIPVKQIRAFVKDIKAIKEVNGWSTRSQTVQLLEKAVPQLTPIVKKHGLRMEKPRKWERPISGFDL